MAENQNRTFQDKFMLRLPDGMRDQIKAAAKENGRSMNAEIVQRLETSFVPPPPMGSLFGVSETDLDAQARTFLAAAIRIYVKTKSSS